MFVAGLHWHPPEATTGKLENLRAWMINPTKEIEFEL